MQDLIQSRKNKDEDPEVDEDEEPIEINVAEIDDNVWYELPIAFQIRWVEIE